MELIYANGLKTLEEAKKQMPEMFEGDIYNAGSYTIKPFKALEVERSQAVTNGFIHGDIFTLAIKGENRYFKKAA